MYTCIWIFIYKTYVFLALVCCACNVSECFTHTRTQLSMRIYMFCFDIYAFVDASTYKATLHFTLYCIYIYIYNYNLYTIIVAVTEGLVREEQLLHDMCLLGAVTVEITQILTRAGIFWTQVYLNPS
jgi:hypothetical protein